MDINPILRTDAYKQGHLSQYPKGTTRVVSNWTPRDHRHAPAGITHMTWFGLQPYILQTLIKDWNEQFFGRPKGQVLDEYKRVVGGMGLSIYPDQIGALHDLGYLPIEIWALREGVEVEMGTPTLVMWNTHPDFFWVTNFLETDLSSNVWGPSTAASIAKLYRDIIVDAADRSGMSTDMLDFTCHDFSYRGMNGLNAAMASGAGHLLSFNGTDSIPAIRYVEEFYGATHGVDLIAGSVPACYDETTEILTERGFIRFAELEEDIRVAQYKEDGTIDFVVPSHYYAAAYKGEMVHFTWNGRYNYIDLLVTPNHKMIEQHRRTGKLRFFEASERNFNQHGDYKLIKAAPSSIEDGRVVDALDRLAIAFQADGSFPSRSHRYNGNRSGTYPIRFSLKREDKKERLVSILDELGVEYTHRNYDDGYHSFWIKLKEPMNKGFDWIDLGQASAGWCKSFIDEIRYWDGSTSSENTYSYYSSDVETAKMVEAVAILAGYKTQFSTYYDKREDRKTQYTVIIDTNRSSVGTNISQNLVDYDGMVYCVSVPSKMLVVRRNDKVAICGNTEHSVMCAGGADDELGTYRRLLEQYPEGVISIVSDTWDYWNVLTNILPTLKSEIMSRDGIVVVRPDSGDPVKIVCGDPSAPAGSPAHKGSFTLLWETFGGSVNHKGFKVLDSHIGLIYGDSITPERAIAICDGLIEKEFCPSMVLGVGSFTYQYITRDTFGNAIKATSVTINGKTFDIYKDPVTAHGGLVKKSAVGIPAVYEDGQGFFMDDGATIDDVRHCAFECKFLDGKAHNLETWADIVTRVRSIETKD